MAATLACGTGAVLSHRSAGCLWGSERIEATRARGIPVTTPARTLLDIAAVVAPHILRRPVEAAEQQELFDLRDVLGAHPRRQGRRALMELLDDVHSHDLPLTRSDVEALMLQLCLDHGVPRPQVNRWDGHKEVDFRWAQRRLVVEIDGWQTHNARGVRARPRAFAAARARRAAAGPLHRAPGAAGTGARRRAALGVADR